MSASLRLDRLLGNLGYGSRREVAGLVRSGRVLLDGIRLSAADGKVPLDPDLPSRLQVEGAPLDPLPGLVVALHKPAGFTCSHDEAGPLVYDLLPPRWRLRAPPLSAAGRLDKETTGLLILTDDGPLLHRIIAPKRHAPKRYRATLAQPLRPDAADVFAAGTLTLSGEEKPLLPADLVVVTPTIALVTIVEGRYHQVRRMFAALGNRVVALRREQVGAFALPADLAEGNYRILDRHGISALMEKPEPGPI